MGKYLFVFLLTALLYVNDVNGGWVRRAWGKVKKHSGTALNIVSTVGRIAGLFGKRSADGELSKINLCYFESMDLDGDKTVTEDEIKVLIDMTGVPEINSLFELLDQDDDGKISIEDYRDVISYCTEEKILELNKKISNKAEQKSESQGQT